MNKSWKTTLAGAIGAIGLGLSNATGQPAWLHTVGVILAAAGSALMGWAARDNDKSSEDVGAKH